MVGVASDANFQAEVLDAQIPVLVDFWAPWCGPCRMVSPILERISEKAGDTVKVLKLNVDENPQTAGTYRITAIPTVILFRNGSMAEQFIGVQPEQVYLNAIGM